jgi:hypothetical protein
MNRQEFLEKAGLLIGTTLTASNIVLAEHRDIYPYSFDTCLYDDEIKELSKIKILFAEHENMRYMIMDNNERIFKESIVKTDELWRDVENLKKNMMQSLLTNSDTVYAFKNKNEYDKVKFLQL